MSTIDRAYTSGKVRQPKTDVLSFVLDHWATPPTRRDMAWWMTPTKRLKSQLRSRALAWHASVQEFRWLNSYMAYALLAYWTIRRLTVVQVADWSNDSDTNSVLYWKSHLERLYNIFHQHHGELTSPRLDWPRV